MQRQGPGGPRLLPREAGRGVKERSNAGAPRAAEHSPVFGAVQLRRPLRAVRRGLPGVGRARAEGLCRRRGLLPSTPWGQLAPGLQKALEKEAAALPLTGEALALQLRHTRARRARSGSVRSRRRRRGLPVRGQRTKANGRTAKRLNAGRFHRFA